MKQVRSYGRHRNDYLSDFRCEHCGHQSIGVPSYADYNFNSNVIPNALCPTCNKSSNNETEAQQKERLGRTYRHWKGHREVPGKERSK